MGIIEATVSKFALDTLLGFVAGDRSAPAEDSKVQDPKIPQGSTGPGAQAKALAQGTQPSLEKAAQLFARQAPTQSKSPYPSGPAEDLVEFLNGEGQHLPPVTRTLGYIEAARRESDTLVQTAYLESAYQEAWKDLSGVERTMVRRAHAQVLISEKEKNDPALREAAFNLAQDWQHSLATGTEITHGDSAVRVMALAELAAFDVAMGEGIDSRDGRTKKLISLGKDQGLSPRQLLETELSQYGKSGTPQEKLEQYELAALAAGRMLDVKWGAGAVAILETVRGFNAADLKGSEAAEARQMRLGVYQLYKQAQLGITEELKAYPEEDLKHNLESLDNLIRFDPRNERLQDIRSLKTALEIAASRATATTADLEQESRGDFRKVARALHKMEQGQVEDATKILQNLLKAGSITDSEAQALLNGLSGIVPAVLKNSLGRQRALVEAFAKGKEIDFESELDAIDAYVASLPVAHRPGNLNDAIYRYGREAGEPRDLTELKGFLFDNRLEGLIGKFSNVDSAQDVEEALEQLDLVLEADCHYFEGDGDLAQAIHQTASDLLARAPRGSETAKKVARFRYDILDEEMKRHTYTEWALLIATLPIGLGAGAAAASVGRAVGTRVAARLAVQTSTGLTTAELAELGIATWSRAAVFGEAANFAANATTFWGVNTAANSVLFPEAPHQSLPATAMDLGFAHYLMRAMRIRAVGNHPLARAFAGAIAMSSSGSLRVGIHQVAPGLGMAQDGETPWTSKAFLQNFAAGLGMEAGGNMMHKFSPAKALGKKTRPEVIFEEAANPGETASNGARYDGVANPSEPAANGAPWEALPKAAGDPFGAFLEHVGAQPSQISLEVYTGEASADSWAARAQLGSAAAAANQRQGGAQVAVVKKKVAPAVSPRKTGGKGLPEVKVEPTDLMGKWLLQMASRNIQFRYDLERFESPQQRELLKLFGAEGEAFAKKVEQLREAYDYYLEYSEELHSQKRAGEIEISLEQSEYLEARYHEVDALHYELTESPINQVQEAYTDKVHRAVKSLESVYTDLARAEIAFGPENFRVRKVVTPLEQFSLKPGEEGFYTASAGDLVHFELEVGPKRDLKRVLVNRFTPESLATYERVLESLRKSDGTLPKDLDLNPYLLEIAKRQGLDVEGLQAEVTLERAAQTVVSLLEYTNPIEGLEQAELSQPQHGSFAHAKTGVLSPAEGGQRETFREGSKRSVDVEPLGILDAPDGKSKIVRVQVQGDEIFDSIPSAGKSKLEWVPVDTVVEIHVRVAGEQGTPE